MTSLAPTPTRPAAAEGGVRRDEPVRAPQACWREAALIASDGAFPGEVHLEALLDRLGRDR